MAEEEGAAEVITLSSESEEDDDVGETVTPEGVIGRGRDRAGRAMAPEWLYRSVRRAYTWARERIPFGSHRRRPEDPGGN
ncbi:GM22057 [Drosophila sechellia]|uniref:GM22057 n=1 Tax=Drosophila sechellia TaxID=7238 RepID=B4IP64_DROSE|nr:GM22057 [Drosophila sechellia]